MPVTPPPPGLTEADYERIEAAVMETARGRWFLTEFARRVREGESAHLLHALGRLERLVESAMAPSSTRAPALAPAASAPALAAPERTNPAERGASTLLARIEPLAHAPAAPAAAPADPSQAFALLAGMTSRDRLAFFA